MDATHPLLGDFLSHMSESRKNGDGLIAKCCEPGVADELHRLVHSMATSAHIMGFEKLATSARKMENLFASFPQEDADKEKFISVIHDAWNTVCTELDALPKNTP